MIIVTEPGGAMVWAYVASLLAAFALGGFLSAALADAGLAAVAWAARRIRRARP